MGCSTVVMIVILIAVAILLFFNFTDQNALISGGHKVTHNGKTLHIKNFKKLKSELNKLHRDWDPTRIHEEAEDIVKAFLVEMEKKSDLEYHEQAEYIDNKIAKYIDDMIAEYHKQSQTI